MTPPYSGGPPRVGVNVQTSDGDKLGTFKEVSDNCFKVDAPKEWTSGWQPIALLEAMAKMSSYASQPPTSMGLSSTDLSTPECISTCKRPRSRAATAPRSMVQAGLRSGARVTTWWTVLAACAGTVVVEA